MVHLLNIKMFLKYILILCNYLNYNTTFICFNVIFLCMSVLKHLPISLRH
jgi:hypothetical protein